VANLRVILAVLAFIAIAAGAFQPMYLRMYNVDRSQMQASFEELPYRKLPGLRALMLEVRRRTPPDARIALWIPDHKWDGGYGYAFHRVPFLLPDKRVLPMVALDRDEPTARYLSETDFIACWQPCPPVERFRSLWRSNDGELLVRAR